MSLLIAIFAHISLDIAHAAGACEYSYLLSALIKSARGFDNALTMPERLDKATRRREPVRAFLHYVEKLSKAKRRGANPRKIATVVATRIKA